MTAAITSKNAIRDAGRAGAWTPLHYVPSSDAFAHAVRLGLGWGMVPELQVPPGNDELIDLDPQGAIDIPLFWQQWRLHSAPLDRVAAAVQRSAQELVR